MTYATYLEREDVRFIYYVTIGGLPYVFSHVEQPSAWTLAAGFSWDKSLLHFRDSGVGSFESSLQSVSQRLDWERGVTLSGSIEVEFLYDPEDSASTWQSLLNPTTRSVWYKTVEDITTPSSTLFDWQTGGAPADDTDVYFGVETITTGGLVGSSSLSCTRGVYNSVPQWYGMRGNNLPIGGPTEGTSWPTVWRGRPISIWRAACTVDQDGNRVPISTEIQGDHDREVFRGTMYELDWDVSRTGIVLFECQSIDQLLERSVMTRARVYRPGPGALGSGWCYVESGGPHLIECSMSSDNFETLTGTDPAPGHIFDLTSAAPGFAGPKLASADDTAGAIADALSDHYSIDANNGIRFTHQLWPDDDGEVYVRFGAVAEAGGSLEPIRGPITLHLETARFPKRSVLWALGATEDIVISPTDEIEDFDKTIVHWSWGTAHEQVPHYYLGKRGQSRLYYHGVPDIQSATTADPPDRQRTFDRRGQTDDVAIRFGEHEMMRVRFRALETGPLYFDETFTDYPYALINQDRRGLMFQPRVDIVVPADEVEDEKHAIHLGVLFDNHDLMDSVRWLLVSNGDSATGAPWTGDAKPFNILPEGFGASIPSSYIDNDTFEKLQLTRCLVTNGWWIEESQSLRSILGQIGQALNVNFTGGLGSGTAGDLIGRQQITVRELSPAIETAVTTIDTSWTDTINAPPMHERNERNVINRVELEFDFSPFESKFLSKNNTMLDLNSVIQYGNSRALKLKLPWLHGLASVLPRIQVLSSRTFQAKGRPHAIYRVPFVRPIGWKIEVGDVVNFTNPRLPNYESGGYGLVDVPMRVMSITQDLSPSGQTLGELELMWLFKCPVKRWSPSARIASLSSGTTYVLELDSITSGFSLPEDNVFDVSWFDQGQKIECYVPGEDTIESRTIDAIDKNNSTITLDTAITLTPINQVVIQFEDYNFSGLLDNQKDYVYLCDVSTFLNTDADTDTQLGARWY